MLSWRIITTALIVTALSTLTALASGPVAGGVYQGPGIVVTQFGFGQAGITVVDNGAVVCDDSPTASNVYSGNGGVCLPFETLYHRNINPDYRNAIHVLDGQHDAVFQVCVDNNRDGVCRGVGEAEGNFPLQPSSCDIDTILYSHDTRTGANFNPLHVPDWVEGFWAWCGAAYSNPDAWPGYIVILCSGVHNDGHGAGHHVHQVSSGWVQGTYTPDTRVGDYCGAPTAAKAYVVV